MSNTISSTLKPDAVVNALITVANNRLAPLRAFSKLFSPDVMRPGATLQIPLATAGAAGQTNPTNFETGDTTLTPISVTLALKTVSFHVTQSDLNHGFGLEHVAPAAAQNFCNLLSDVYTAVMTVANYGAGIQIGVAQTFAGDSLAPVLAAAKNFNAKNLLLDAGHLAYLLPTDKFNFALGEQGAYGFDLIAQQNRWTGAASNAVGFVCSPDAIAIGAGRPATPQTNQFDTVAEFTLPDLELPVLYRTWFNTATGTQWGSFQTMFGAAVGDATQGEVLVTA